MLERVGQGWAMTPPRYCLSLLEAVGRREVGYEGIHDLMVKVFGDRSRRVPDQSPPHFSRQLGTKKGQIEAGVLWIFGVRRIDQVHRVLPECGPCGNIGSERATQ